MLLNKFYINVIIRITAIAITSVVLGITLQHLEQGYYYTLAGTIFLIILQSWLLVNSVNRTNADLEIFFSSVQDHNSSVRFPENKRNDSFRKLHDRMNSLNSTIQSARIENERTSQFLKSVVDHVDTGLISFDKTGHIEIYNRAADMYLKLHQSRQLSSLKDKDEDLFKILSTIKPGQEILYKLKTEKNLLKSILLKSTELKIERNVIKLVSFQDITAELDKKELDSWQRLIRVLTHEIMNSISPITSLTSVISGYFKKDDETRVPLEKLDHQIVTRTLSGLNTIEETGKGLLNFVDKYRSLTSLPKPDLCKFPVESLFRKVKILMDSNISSHIKIIATACPEDISIAADYAQIEQVLINLIKNATEALSCSENGTIHLKAFLSGDYTLIQVEDNGTGIQADIIEDIFVPFYTTKETGSGIGLSLSRQIMQNHGGTISVNSIPGKGSLFTLKFPV